MFQKIIEQKYLKSTTTPDELDTAWQKYSATFLNAEKQNHIRESKEEQYQEGFIRDLFCAILGYTINPEPNFNIITEKKNDSDSRKANGAKAKIPLKSQPEWNETFDSYKAACLGLQQQIAATDASINAQVYKLYGLYG